MCNMSYQGTLTISPENFFHIDDETKTKSILDESQDERRLFSQLKEWRKDPNLESTYVNIENELIKESNFDFESDTHIDATTSNSNRLQLLARKYISETLSNEDEARFQIESERVKKLLPLVDESDIKNIGNAIEELRKVKKRNKKIKKYLGLK